MYCKWCGMDSRDNQRCEWCGRPFVTPNGPQATTAVPPQPTAAPPPTQQPPVAAPPVYAPPQQVAAPPVYQPKPEVVDAPPVYQPRPEGEAPPVYQPGAVSVAPPTYQPEEEEAPPSPMYIGAAPPPQTTISMPPQPTVAMAPQPTQAFTGATDPRDRAAQRAADYQDDDAVSILLPFPDRLERYLGIMLPLLAIGMLLAHQFPDAWLVPFLLLLFPSGMLLGCFRVIGYYDDEYADALILVVISSFIGPIYGTAVYAVYGLIKQDLNYSMLGLMASFIVLLFVIGSAAVGAEEIVNAVFAVRISFGIDRLIQLIPLALIFGGWMCASFTRPLNEN